MYFNLSCKACKDIKDNAIKKDNVCNAIITILED